MRGDYPPRELIKSNVRSIQNNNYHYAYDYQYSRYAISGKTYPFIVDGTADNGSATTLVDESKDFDALGVSVGNIARNESDINSYATVSGVSGNTLTLENDWSGGIDKRFAYGNKYRIELPERTLHQLWVWPIQDFQRPKIYEGVPTNIQFNSDDLVYELSVKFSSLVSGWDADTNLRVELRDGTSTIFDASIVNPQTENMISLRATQVRHNRNYTLHVFDPVDRSNLVSEVVFYGYEDNYLELDYVPYPRQMHNENDVCELDEFLWELMYSYATELAFMKKDALDPRISNLKAERRLELVEAKRTLRMRGGKPVTQTRKLTANPEYDDTETMDATEFWGGII